MLMKTGFIGLGTLGKPMAKRLISEGVDLIVWNRTKKKTEDLGVEIAESPAELTSKAKVIFLNLFDSEAVREVLTDEKGVFQGKCKGRIIVDTTTNHFGTVAAFHETARKKGAVYIESPVLGSVVPASQGNLTVLASGDASGYEEALPYLEKIAKHIFYLQKPGLATKMKLINNLALGSFMATIAETLLYGEAIGLEKEAVLDILAVGGGKSLVLDAKREKLLKEDFSTHFSSDCIYKDLHCLQDLARELKRPLFTGSVTKELFGMALSRGMGEADFSAVYKILKES